jgi:maltokinase
MTDPEIHDTDGDVEHSEHPQMTTYLGEARWFAGKGRSYDVVEVQRIGTLPGPPTVTVDILTVQYAATDTEAAAREHYQMPLSHYAEEQGRIRHAYIGPHYDEDLGEVHTYDAVHDREAMQVYLETFAATAPETPNHYGGLTFHRLAGHDLDTEMHSTLFSGEQSNSSVAFGDDSLLKVFRRVNPGRNPDIEVHRALTEAGSSDVASLYGWIEDASAQHEEGGEVWDLGMLQQFLRTASDGWDLALASARNLFAEGDLHADEVGGDFAGEAFRLGVTVSEIHDLLRQHFGTSSYDAKQTAEAMHERLDAATLERLFASVAEAGNAPEVLESAQRVHGDLHLGQTLRTSLGWKLVDFEGEPLKSLEERRLPDSPWRDVAGMLRSFDYAAQSVVKDLHAGDEPTAQILYRAHEWTNRNRQAFLDGYVEHRTESGGGQLTPTELALIGAYEADKAVYEVLYEARNRPTWLDIPLTAIDRIGATG